MKRCSAPSDMPRRRARSFICTACCPTAACTAISSHLFALLELGKKQKASTMSMSMPFWTAGTWRRTAPENTWKQLMDNMKELGSRASRHGARPILCDGPG